MSGMCSNPFGGNNSLNNLDDYFMAALFKGELSVDQAIALRIIKMSVRDYLFFGLGKNGITPERFIEAYQYLFKVNSQDPRTWGNYNTKERYKDKDGKFIYRKTNLSYKEVQGKCFDIHYEIVGLDIKLPLDNFRALLKKKRELILNENLKQVIKYMGQYRNEEWCRLPPTRRKGKYTFPRHNVISTLVSPEDCKDLAHLYLYGSSIKNKKVGGYEKIPKASTLKYKCLLFENL